jgi:hypothetical protein
MSTLFVLTSEVRAYRGRVIRVVEGQHQMSTNRLAGNAADQAHPEAFADNVKPHLPEAARRLPWLLASPFRYPLGRPSRLRAADVLPGIFFAAEDVETALAETAYWRLVAFSRSRGFLRPRTPTPMHAPLASCVAVSRCRSNGRNHHASHTAPSAATLPPSMVAKHSRLYRQTWNSPVSAQPGGGTGARGGPSTLKRRRPWQSALPAHVFASSA